LVGVRLLLEAIVGQPVNIPTTEVMGILLKDHELKEYIFKIVS